MIKKTYIFSLILFVLATALPFRKTFIDYLRPTTQGTSPIDKNIKTDDKFITSANNFKYTEPQPIEFKYADFANEEVPEINGTSAIVVDLSTNQIIYAKNETDARPVASLTKIMTAILAIEYSYLDKEVTISSNAASIGENTMGIGKGEKYTIEELLYGLFLNSGNDAAYAIAETTAGDEKTFVNWMNRKAKLVGANNTNFVDSYGLNANNKDFYSTALDMAKISAYLIKDHRELEKIYSTFIKEIPEDSNHKYIYLENQTNLLTTYPGVKGLKTGYTEEAGLCLISYAENEGKEVLVVVLNSIDRKGDAILLLDYAYNKLGITIEHNLL